MVRETWVIRHLKREYSQKTRLACHVGGKFHKLSLYITVGTRKIGTHDHLILK